MVVNAKNGVSTTVSCEDRPKEIWDYGFALAQVKLIESAVCTVDWTNAKPGPR